MGRTQAPHRFVSFREGKKQSIFEIHSEQTKNEKKSAKFAMRKCANIWCRRLKNIRGIIVWMKHTIAHKRLLNGQIFAKNV